MKNATIISDASFYHETFTGGWAAYCRSDRGITRGSGLLRPDIGSSTVAEMMAAVNGLYVGLRDGVVLPGYVCLFQIDNTDAITRLQNLNAKNLRGAKSVIKEFGKLVRLYNLTPRFKHIKAHVKPDQPRTWVHDWCDRASREKARNAHSSKSLSEARTAS